MTVSCKLMSYKLAVSLIIFLVVLSGVIYLVLLPNPISDIQTQTSTETLNTLPFAQTQTSQRLIEIQTDGSIFDSDPVTPLKRSGNVYTFSGDINGHIDIQKSGITLDGAGYTLRKADTQELWRNFRHGLGIPQGVDGVTVKNIQIADYWNAINLAGSNSIVTNITITRCTATDISGILVSGSNNIIQNCHIVGNSGNGIHVEGSNNAILDNIIADNGRWGIFFHNAPIKLRSNILNNNYEPFCLYEYNKDASGQPVKIKSNYIDSTNLVEGKPVYYWVNEQDKTVPSNAGYVVLDNCKNIVVENLEINWSSLNKVSTLPDYVIRISNSDNIVVKNNFLTQTDIWCASSNQNVLICNNNLTIGSIYSAGFGTSILGNSIFQSKKIAITVATAAEAVVAQNVLINCDTGISLNHCALTSVMNNTLKECRWGIYLYNANDNTITQNNFIDNVQHAGEDHYVWPFTAYYLSVNTTWDRNYWSTYTGIDADGDGIGDTPYVVFENITDYYPLMTMIDLPDVSVPLSDPSEIFFKYSTVAVLVLIVGVGVGTIVSLFYFKKKQNKQETPNP